MKTTKSLLVLITTILVLWLGLASASAMYGERTGNGINFTDSNSDWVADCQEDWDNDGILNLDDEDFVRTYPNMKDDDGDWIANRDDEDFVRTPKADWTGKANSNGKWMKRGGNR